MNNDTKKGHCASYVCVLESGCCCRCVACLEDRNSLQTDYDKLKEAYEAIKQKYELVTKTCPTCGRGPEVIPAPIVIPYIPYNPYINPGWWCNMCQMYHPYGQSCIRYYPPVIPWTVSAPNTTVPNLFPNTTITYTTDNDLILTDSTGYSLTISNITN